MPQRSSSSRPPPPRTRSRPPCDEFGELAPADHAYWTKQGWLEKGRRYYVDVPVNPVYHALGVGMEGYTRRRVRRDLREVG